MKGFELLGLKVSDKVTGIEGICTSICYDLFGCIQATINPGLDKDGKPREYHWYDINRIKVLDSTPCIDLPDFCTPTSRVAQGLQGAAEKPGAWKP